MLTNAVRVCSTHFKGSLFKRENLFKIQKFYSNFLAESLTLDINRTEFAHGLFPNVPNSCEFLFELIELFASD